MCVFLQVSGYNNELLCYVPSERVLREGHYEGTEGMLEYRHPTVFAPGIEARIHGLVHELVQGVDQGGDNGVRPPAAAL